MASSCNDALFDDALAEILARLPSSAVLRCRAVCKRWRRVTTDPFFLAAHAARRPREMIILTDEWTLSAVPISPDLQDPPTDDVDGTRRYLCDPNLRDRHGNLTGWWCRLLASLDGLLVLQQRAGLYIVCNPTTRQWTNLPVLPPFSAASACGFYFHGPSGEYRLLCHAQVAADGDDGGWKDYYYTLSAGAAEPRRLARAPAVERDEMRYEFPVAHRGILYWYCLHLQATRTGKMLAFRTDSETFRLVSRPPCGASAAALLELDGALCAAALENNDMTLLQIWSLQLQDQQGRPDEEASCWTLRHRVVLPQPRLRVVSMNMAISAGDGVILAGYTPSSRVVRLCDVKGKRLHRELQFRSTPAFLAFNESLVSHHFFNSLPTCPDLAPLKFAAD